MSASSRPAQGSRWRRATPLTAALLATAVASGCIGGAVVTSGHRCEAGGANGCARNGEPFGELERRLRELVAGAAPAEVAVALVDLETGGRIELDGDLSVHAASTMKVPVMFELFRQADAGRFAVDDSVLVTNEFRSILDGSSFVLAEDTDTELVEGLGRRATLRRLALGMTVVSSNLATNILIELVGAAEVSATMERIGADGMKVLRGVEDIPAFRAGMNNTATAAGFARVLEAIAKCEYHTPTSCAAMHEILEAQEFRDQIPAGLPTGVRVGNKTGSITGIRHDGAIVWRDGREPYVLVVLTRGFDDLERADVLTAEISRAVWTVLGDPLPPAGAD